LLLAQAYYFLGPFVGVTVIGDEKHQKLVVDYYAAIFTIKRSLLFPQFSLL
jgi:hypothetical protein